MLLTHKLSLDLMELGTPQRFQAKQGDTLSRCLEISLFSGGEPWLIPDDATPLVRWRAWELSTGRTASGIFDTLPGGAKAWSFEQNRLELMLVPPMFALPGVVRCDVVLIQGKTTLATFDFEFYVNRAPVNSKEPQVQDYYQVASLDQINTAITNLRSWQNQKNLVIVKLEQEVAALKQMISQQG